MTGVQKIRKALKTIMTEGEANACRIWKGYGGWHIERFGEYARIYGKTIAETLEEIEMIKEEREYYSL